jgi:hypothetical protein
MRVLGALVIVGLLAGPAHAQKAVPRYGELDKDKTPQEKAAEREADKAYQRSLRNIPEKAATDPWGAVRSDATPKETPKTAKNAPARPAKSGSTSN